MHHTYDTQAVARKSKQHLPHQPRLVPLLERQVDELFDRYCAAARHAQSTHDLAAGIEAGKAWRRFLEAFVEVEA